MDALKRLRLKRIILVSILALTAWSYPIHAASAIAEPEQEQIFINYEKFHKQVLRSNEKSPVVKTDSPKINSPSKRVAKVSADKALQQSGRHYSKEEIQSLIIEYSLQYGIGSETPLCIAKLESGYNQFSKNKSSSASGVFQYLSSTWKATDEGKIGLSVFDADANVKAAVKYMGVHKSTRPWVVNSKCPKLTFLKN